MSNQHPPLLKHDIIRSFSQAADTYDAAALLQRDVADRLLERLDYFKLTPTTVLDLGAGTGYSTKRLEQRYKKAKIIALDISKAMLLKSKEKKRWFDRRRYVCGDAETLPFQDQSFDLIFSNLMLHWCANPEKAIQEMHRVLRPDGLVLFSTLGPDTFYEIRQSWATVDNKPHVHTFIDMHDIGDSLQHSHFKDPVMDMEYITLTYSDLPQLLIDIKDLGTQNIAPNRTKGLTGKRTFDLFISAYEKHRNAQGLIPLTYEVIYGLGWGKKALKTTNEVAIPIDAIGRVNK